MPGRSSAEDEQRRGCAQARNGVVPVPVYLTDGQSLSKQLAAAVSRSAAQGVTIRALLITNPDNPTGMARCLCCNKRTRNMTSIMTRAAQHAATYSLAQGRCMTRQRSWRCCSGVSSMACTLSGVSCNSRSAAVPALELPCDNLNRRASCPSVCIALCPPSHHFLLLICIDCSMVPRSDEIYANSVFGEAQFQSAAQLAASAPAAVRAASANLCHVVFGLSKDWCRPQRSVKGCAVFACSA